MTCLISLLICVAGTLMAQFSDLATTADGSVLYFSTTGRLAGTDLPYRVTPSGPELAFSEEYREVTTFYLSLPTSITNFYALRRPQPSDDASVVAYTGSSTCTGYQCRNRVVLQHNATVVSASGSRKHGPSSACFS